MWSLSARRAWIEMYYVKAKGDLNSVALRKESVDRNMYPLQCRTLASGSLSARRAWIEIVEEYLNAGSLDRRSPQGERG